MKYAHPGPAKILWRKRCKVQHSPKYPARCKLPRDHEGECRFGWLEIGGHKVNLDGLPELSERFSPAYEDALRRAKAAGEPEDAR